MPKEPTYVPRPLHAFIGNKTYQIQWVTEDEWQTAGKRGDKEGATFQGVCVIEVRLCPGYSEDHLRENLLHELLHGVWAETGLTNYYGDLDRVNLEESLVGMQSPSLLFILRQNPEVVAYLTATDR